MTDPDCSHCGEPYPQARAQLGFSVCLDCGERQAIQARKSWCVAPLHKSNYMLVTDPTLIPGMVSKTNNTHGKES